MRRIIRIDKNKLTLSRTDFNEINRSALEEILVGIGDKHVDAFRDEMGVVFALFVKSHAIDKTAIILTPYGDAQVHGFCLIVFRRATDLIGGFRSNFNHGNPLMKF